MLLASGALVAGGAFSLPLWYWWCTGLAFSLPMMAAEFFFDLRLVTPPGVVVNVARGANVDEAELVRALAEGRIAGAGLEVFDDEPNVPKELMGMDNVVLTPHQAVFTPESMADVGRLTVANLDAFFAGKPLLTSVAVSEREKMAPPSPNAAGVVSDAGRPPLVLLTRPLFSEFAAALDGRFTFVLAADADEATAAEARVLLGPALAPVTADLVDRFPKLEILVATSAGVDHIDLDACRRRGITVTNAGDAFSAESADYAVGLVVAVLRRVVAAEAYLRQGRWAKDGDYPLATKVSGKRVGIVGLGSIGSMVARRLAAFGCIISYNSRSEKPSVPYKFYAGVRELAADSDVMVLSCALTEETRHMVNREVMEALGKDGVLVNVGRGGLVDEPEMVRCLQEGVIGGAGLDVYENEPAVPPELFAMDNVVLSDHRAVITPESIQGVLDVVAGNLDAFFSGKPLLSPVKL
uniref:D-isomer specific 2-hydroxyacid dehydrogenase NAD-binding domain-containing protein n=1 Tax=Leersia perrieri TaxID=77586 RepID=A0A0D9W1S7_9ORYZ